MRFRRTGLIVGLLLLALFVAACGGKKEETSSSAGNAEAVEIVIELGAENTEFVFNPNEIEVKVNQPVRLVLKNVGKLGHDLHIPEFNVGSPVIAAGEEYELEFVPNKVGTFAIECHEAGHAASGMTGTLKVVS